MTKSTRTNQQRWAVNVFTKIIGREPTADDIQSQSTMDELKEGCLCKGYSLGTVGTLERELKLLFPQPKPEPKPTKPAKPVIKFDLSEPMWARCTEKEHKTLRAFSYWLGRQAKLADLTDEAIIDYTLTRPYGGRVAKVWTLSGKTLRAVRKRASKPLVVKVPIVAKDSVWSFWEDHYKPKRLLGRSENTFRIYRVTIQKYANWLGRTPMLSDLTDDNLAKFVNSLNERGQSIHTAERDMSALMALWRFAHRTGRHPDYPTVQKPKCPDTVPDAFTREELSKLLTAAKLTKGDYAGVPAGLWWESLLRTILDSAERVGAVLQAEKTHYSDGWLTVPAAHRKGGLRGKRYKLSAKTTQLVNELLKVQVSSTIWYWPYAYASVWRRYNDVLRSAGLPTGRRGKLHKLRRTTATYFEAAGGNATTLLGHQNRKTTEAYLDSRFIAQQHPCDLIDPY